MGDLSDNFSRSEFECHCGECEHDTVDGELLEVLEDIRLFFATAVSINSGHRCPNYNKDVGGSKNSQHLMGRAADIVVAHTSAYVVQEYLLNEYPFKFGIGRYEDFTHIDTRSGPPARWGKTL